MPNNMLSKSKVVAGWQCEKLAYLNEYKSDQATPFDEAALARFADGTRFGELVLGIWPDGILVADPFYRHDQSVERTRQLLDDPGVTVIFEAGFTVCYRWIPKCRLHRLQRLENADQRDGGDGSRGPGSLRRQRTMKAFNGTPHSNGGQIKTSSAVKDTPNSKRKAPPATIGGGGTTRRVRPRRRAQRKKARERPRSHRHRGLPRSIESSPNRHRRW